jgi:hypothetical protein
VRIGRRPLFFGGVALVCLLLFPATPAEFRWVNLAAAGVAIFWAVLLAVEEVVSRRAGALPPGAASPSPGVLRPPPAGDRPAAESPEIFPGGRT